MRELSREFSVRQREMRSREQGLLRLLDPLCVQWKPLDQHLPLLRLAGSQGDAQMCPSKPSSSGGAAITYPL